MPVHCTELWYIVFWNAWISRHFRSLYQRTGAALCENPDRSRVTLGRMTEVDAKTVELETASELFANRYSKTDAKRGAGPVCWNGKN